MTSAIPVTALICFTVWQIWNDVLPLLAAMVDVAKTRWAPDVEEEDADESFPPLPPDIEQLALAESEEWAQESVRDRARELYRSLDRDWDKTKQVLIAERHATIFGDAQRSDKVS